MLTSEFHVIVLADGPVYWMINTVNHGLSAILSIPQEVYNFSFFFIANNLNWSKAVSDFQEFIYPFNQYFNGNITATEIDNGFIYNTQEGTFNETHKEIEITTSYNENGVLKNCEITYDSASLLTFILSSGGVESIIGFNPLITILTSIIPILSVAFYIKKIRKTHQQS